MLELLHHDTAHGQITELRLARPPANALNLELLQALRQAIESAPGQGARGLILSGAPGMFSAGVDVPALLALDRAGVEAFWRAFFAACAALARAPVPVVAAIGGHSPAGGAVLSLYCDYRVMARGPYRIGLNEVQVGLTAPEVIQLALRRVVGAYRAERLLVAGTLLDAEAAQACGLVDELVVDGEETSLRALHWLQALLALPARAMLATRRIARAELIDAFADSDALPVHGFVDAFFQDDTQAVLHALVARLKAKSG